ncbi:hypothetical protein ACJX0J_008418, partial [Zea mays]
LKQTDAQFLLHPDLCVPLPHHVLKLFIYSLFSFLSNCNHVQDINSPEKNAAPILKNKKPSPLHNMVANKQGASTLRTKSLNHVNNLVLYFMSCYVEWNHVRRLYDAFVCHGF